MKVAILYSELAAYTIACLEALSNTGTEICLVHWPINKEAPFQFDLSFCKHHVSRDETDDGDIQNLLFDFSPDLILCSGWIDKGYVKICRSWKHKIPTVIALDNHWTGSLRQRVATLLANLTIKTAFSHAYVPGRPQQEFTRRLGFPDDRSKTGFYSADVDAFNDIYAELKTARQSVFPKRFLYLGRYVQHKGIFDLWSAFKEVRKVYPDWELWCCGTGDEYDNREEYEGLRHFGFKQPEELAPILEETGVYVLTSHFEPWGVSVHEMAAAGFPMILSSSVGAKEAFLEEGKNGFEYTSADVDQLKEKMLLMAGKSEEELRVMAEHSHKLGQEITPKAWADNLLSLI